MKKIIALIFSVVIIFSCTDLEDLNENVKDPANVPGESLFTGAQKRLVDQMLSTNVNFNIFRLIVQYWTEVTYTDESNYDLVTRTIPEQHWRVLYRDVLKDLDEADKVISETTVSATLEGEKTNKLAIIEIMSVYAWSVLVETFGDIPYTEALDIDILLPQYDDGLTIYRDLITRLNAAIANLDDEHGSFGNADNLYQGDVEMWILFANSLKLRMGLLLADVDGTLSVTTVNAAVAAGVISSNDENATYTYSSTQPNTNPLYVDLVASGRFDFIPSKGVVDVMNGLNDPRRAGYFTLYEGIYVGGENGVPNTYNSYSHIDEAIQAPDFEGDILDYAEMEFLLAEAAARGGYNVSNPALHYENAIRASIEFWGGTTAEADAYLAQSSVAYATATGTWQQKIGTQKYIALYNRGYEAWTSWRMLDYPVLELPPEAVSGTPVRLTYPIVEQTLNKTNYETASTAIGGDEVEIQLFWDIN